MDKDSRIVFKEGDPIMAPKWRAGSVHTPRGLTCDLAPLPIDVTRWHGGLVGPSHVTPDAPDPPGGCIIA